MAQIGTFLSIIFQGTDFTLGGSEGEKKLQTKCLTVKKGPLGQVQ